MRDTDKIKEILNANIPFDSLAFKDASGTTPPSIVYDSIKNARKLLPKDTKIQFHTHDTAGMGVACNLAAIEAGADMIDLAMAPVSGGTSQVDILTMWQRLRGTKYTLDIDEEKILEVEKLFIEKMEKYYLPPEANTVNPIIPFFCNKPNSVMFLPSKFLVKEAVGNMFILDLSLPLLLRKSTIETLSIIGLVFGMVTTEVTPPDNAALLKVLKFSLYS